MHVLGCVLCDLQVGEADTYVYVWEGGKGEVGACATAAVCWGGGVGGGGKGGGRDLCDCGEEVVQGATLEMGHMQRSLCSNNGGRKCIP